MKIYHSYEHVPYEATAVALGEFDGLHTAHMSLIRQTEAFAADNNIPFGVMCFDNKIGMKTAKGESGMLCEKNEKLQLLSHCDFLYIQHFDDSFKALSPEEFCDFLKERLHAYAVFAGFNYRFGKNAEGDVNTLFGYNGFKVNIADEYKINGVTVSSTEIRRRINDGDIETANVFLGRPYKLSGIVEHGKQNGRKMGFPTVNLKYNPKMQLPAFGVYAGFVIMNGMRLPGVINIGKNPTFNADKVTVEAYIFDFETDVYGRYIEIEFIKRLRPDSRFKDILMLKRQIETDKKNAAYILDNL